MALRYTEKWESEEGTVGKDGDDQLIVQVWGNPLPVGSGGDDADNPVTVFTFIAPIFPLVTVFGHVLKNLKRKRIAPGWWMITGEYGSPSGDRQTNDASFHFTTGGGTQHLTTSISTVQGYGRPGDPTPPNFKQLIGVGGNDSVAGVDIPIRKFSFKTTFYVSPAKMTPGYCALVYDLTATVNSDPVIITVDGVQFTFQPGELLYENGEGGKRLGYEDWEFTLNWSANGNATNLTIGDVTNIAKDGWDYLWVYYQPDVDDGAQKLVHVPYAVYVERVYERDALTPLLLTTSFGLGNSQPWVGLPSYAGAGIS